MKINQWFNFNINILIHVIQVNGALVAAGYTEADRFSIIVNGRFIRFESAFGLVVDSDGDELAILRIPTDYNNQVDGLCADYNGDPGNDLTTSGGVDVSGDANKYAVFGNSWQVDDSEDPL